jgi:hypothetical protein
MKASVDWVASALLAAWERQEGEGRYRGADEFRALHIDAADALASWRAATLPVTPWPDELVAWFGEWAVAAQESDGLALDDASRLVAALALAVELEPRLRPLVAALGDDPTARAPTVGLACELAGAAGVTAADVRRAVGSQGRLAWFDLVRVLPVVGRPSGLDAQVVASPWLLGTEQVEEVEQALMWISAPAGSCAAAESRRPSLLVLSGADHLGHAERAAALWGADRAALASEPPDPGGLRRLARTAVVAGAPLVVCCDRPPELWLVAGLDHASELGVQVGISLGPGTRWGAPPSWRPVVVPPLGPEQRVERWRAALGDRGVLAAAADVRTVASEFALGAGAIQDAAARVRVTTPEGSSPEVAALREAARSTLWRDLATVARPGPTGVGWDDLVVAPKVHRQLREIAAAIGNRSRVLDVWGFADRPGSRGYHLLFAGPTGTGKTLGAAVVAGAVGLELWVVDLARVVDKYLGETEKQLDRVLRAAESAGAMLLFDEADALFGRRGDVREARDRWANVEVAYLLQRIEEHDGVTVLTTNLSQNIDEAFARRMSQRVEFGVPDAELRRRLWRMSVPSAAPMADDAALHVVADRFELAGGAIRTAALNAAYAAAGRGETIELVHLVQASVLELTKAGRAPTRDELADLAPLIASGAP